MRSIAVSWVLGCRGDPVDSSYGVENVHKLQTHVWFGDGLVVVAVECESQFTVETRIRITWRMHNVWKKNKIMWGILRNILLKVVASRMRQMEWRQRQMQWGQFEGFQVLKRLERSQLEGSQALRRMERSQLEGSQALRRMERSQAEGFQLLKTDIEVLKKHHERIPRNMLRSLLDKFADSTMLKFYDAGTTLVSVVHHASQLVATGALWWVIVKHDDTVAAMVRKIVRDLPKVRDFVSESGPSA